MTINHEYRYVINLSYLGTNYSGWQIQNNAKSIQGEIMDGLHLILNKNIKLMIGAGRTDSGVHAVKFFAHFDYEKTDCFNLVYRLNRFLSDDIVINNIQIVSRDFHARFSAISRKYEYWISTKKDPFLINRSYFFFKKIDMVAMNEAASLLIGKNNFSAFSKLHSDNPICCVKSAHWIKSKNMLVFAIESDRFLYNMVRCIVGTLMDVGLGKTSITTFSHIMSSYERSRAGVSVPASGLYLMDVKYPKIFKL
jgi:tRNA pseudouridine38-40 synthase